MKNNETGRSMVEMLGVLAIIGVLSVAGIAGYTTAMRKNKANNALSIASQCAILARTYNQTGATDATPCTDLGVDSSSFPAGVSTATTTGQYNSSTDTTTVVIGTTDDALASSISQIKGTLGGSANAKTVTITFAG